MSKWNWFYWSVLPGTAFALLVFNGCNPSKSERSAATSATQSEAGTVGTATPNVSATLQPAAKDGDSEHGHIPGAHGGVMVSLGRDSYHVEAVVDSLGAVRLYTLGKDESRVIEVESQTLKGFAKAAGDADSKAISFEPTPQDGDAQGKTSLFTGQLPTELVGQKLDVTIPNIRIDGERFRLGFVTGQESHGDSEEMPAKVANDAERDLYLTPGGRYTAADIVANGNVTASQKFKGLKSEHDMKPKAGDKLCPISGTKASAKFTWIIDGKPYEFCCPPCVDEYLASAKLSAEPLPDPATFLKK